MLLGEAGDGSSVAMLAADAVALGVPEPADPPLQADAASNNATTHAGSNARREEDM